MLWSQVLIAVDQVDLPHHGPAAALPDEAIDRSARRALVGHQTYSGLCALRNRLTRHEHVDH
jgi:hypothetical protein